MEQLRSIAERKRVSVSALIEKALASFIQPSATIRSAYDDLTVAYQALEAWRDEGDAHGRPFGAAEADHLRRVRIAWDALYPVVEAAPAIMPADPTNILDASNMFVAMSHELTDEQRADAQQHLGITRIITLREVSDELAAKYSNIDPAASPDQIAQFVTQLVGWAIRTGCGVFYCTGEPSVLYQANRLAHAYGLRCVQSTTRREAVETTNPDGSVTTTRVFRHVKWRDLHAPDMP